MGRKFSVRSTPSGSQLFGATLVHASTWVCARFHLSMCMLPVDCMHALSMCTLQLEHVHASIGACAYFHLGTCIRTLEHMYASSWAYACFHLNMGVSSVEYVHASIWACTGLHFSMCSPVLLWAQVNLWKTGRNKQATGTEQFKHIPWKFFRRHGHPCVPYPLFPLFRASIDIIYSRFTHTFPS